MKPDREKKKGTVPEAACNPLCAKCLRSCRQPAGTLLVDCPRYFPRPFRVEKHRFDQLDLFDEKS